MTQISIGRSMGFCIPAIFFQSLLDAGTAHPAAIFKPQSGKSGQNPFQTFWAATNWLAKMLGGGEDPRFIARRLVILASEDVGLADPMALPLAVAAHQACDFVGLPECEYALAHATVYLAGAAKSNSAAMGLFAAKAALTSAPVQAVPVALRDKGGQASKRMGHGEGYLYSHDFPEGISGQEFLEKPLALYTPKNVGFEAKLAERLARWKELKRQIQAGAKRAKG